MECALFGRSMPNMREVNPVPSSTPEPGAAWPEFKDIEVTAEAQ